MGGGEVLRVGLVPELIDLKMFWGEVVLDYSKYNKEKPKIKQKKILKKAFTANINPEYAKYLNE